MNSISCIGHVGKAPLFHTFASGKTKVSFPLAMKEFQAGETKTNWITCEGWETVAERARHITKGREVMITGRLTFQSFERERDGAKEMVHRPVITILGFQLCGKKPELAEALAEDEPEQPAESEPKDRRSRLQSV